MKISLYIARRYLFAKKSRNSINIISSISVAGVTVGTAALIIILSVFNGLESMVRSIFGTFDPDLEIRINEGKVFTPDVSKVDSLLMIDGIEAYSYVLEENALLRYGDKQYIATVRGVEDDYSRITGLDSVMADGEFTLKGPNGREFAVIGLGVANNLGIGIHFLTPLNIYIPKRKGRVSVLNTDVFLREYIFPSGIFSVEQEYDSHHIFVPIDLMRRLLQYENEVSSIELKLFPGKDVSRIQNSVKSLFGDNFTVKNKYQQQEIFYKVMKSEKLAIFVILSFILLIASFNVIGSLTMLIIEKRRDIDILRSLGADNSLIRKIFLFEGWMISVIGALAGILIGAFICWLQMRFGLVKLQGETLILTAYPIEMKLIDFLYVPVTVLTIGFWAAWYPVRYMSKRYLANNVND